jgi:hypothetical protein
MLTDFHSLSNQKSLGKHTSNWIASTYWCIEYSRKEESGEPSRLAATGNRRGHRSFIARFIVAISVLPPMTTEEKLKVIRNWEV